MATNRTENIKILSDNIKRLRDLMNRSVGFVVGYASLTKTHYPSIASDCRKMVDIMLHNMEAIGFTREYGLIIDSTNEYINKHMTESKEINLPFDLADSQPFGLEISKIKKNEIFSKIEEYWNDIWKKTLTIPKTFAGQEDFFKELNPDFMKWVRTITGSCYDTVKLMKESMEFQINMLEYKNKG